MGTTLHVRKEIWNLCFSKQLTKISLAYFCQDFTFACHLAPKCFGGKIVLPPWKTSQKVPLTKRAILIGHFFLRARRTFF